MIRYELNVGAVTKDKRYIGHDRAVDEVKRQLVATGIDGATISRATGWYLGEEEPSVTVVLVGSEEETIRDLCRRLAFALQQDCIMVTRTAVTVDFINGYDD